MAIVKYESGDINNISIGQIGFIRINKIDGGVGIANYETYNVRDIMKNTYLDKEWWNWCCVSLQNVSNDNVFITGKSLIGDDLAKNGEHRAIPLNLLNHMDVVSGCYIYGRFSEFNIWKSSVAGNRIFKLGIAPIK